jgi:hypothetical protein
MSAGGAARLFQMSAGGPRAALPDVCGSAPGGPPDVCGGARGPSQVSAGAAGGASRCLRGRQGGALDYGSVVCAGGSRTGRTAPRMRRTLSPGGGPALRSPAKIVVAAKRAQQLIEVDACEPRPHAGSLSVVRSLERSRTSAAGLWH